MNQELFDLSQKIRATAPRRSARRISSIRISSEQLHVWADKIEQIASGHQPEDGQPHDRRGAWDAFSGVGS